MTNDESAGEASPAVRTATSRLGYAATIEALIAAIASTGGTLFARLDQREAALSVGLTLRPTTLLLFGNPKGGTPLMDAFPLVALDLPLKLLVWEENATVFVAFTPIAELVERYAIAGHDALVAALQRTLDAVVASVA